MISIAQMRAARALLDLSQGDVAEAIGIATNTFSRIESGQQGMLVDRAKDIQNFYESRGVEFTADDGVCKRRAKIIEYSGADGFRAFMEDVYNTVRDRGGLVCIHNVRPAYWIELLGMEWHLMHTGRMQEIEKDYKIRITIKKDDNNLIGSKHAEYRWLPERLWNDQSFYSYGDRLALMNFSPDDVSIRVICSRQFAEGFRSLFSLAWDHIPPIPGVEQRR